MSVQLSNFQETKLEGNIWTFGVVEAGLDNGSVTPDIAVGNCLLKLPGQILEHAPEMHPSIMENKTKQSNKGRLPCLPCLSPLSTLSPLSSCPPTSAPTASVTCFRLIMRRVDLFLR